jgi:hypothetical protein
MCKINIVDARMGFGKTSFFINHINESKDGKFVYITPFLSEVKRIKDNCSDKKFKEPINFGNGKQDNLHDLLANESNIVSTHALFRTSNKTTRQLVEMGEYTLILDEVMDVIEQVKLKKNDLEDLKRLGYITVESDNRVIWNEASVDYEGAYDEIREMARNKSLYLISDVLLMWNFPTEVFESFKEVYILTYMFDGQIQRYYYDMHDIDFEYCTITKDATSGEYKMVRVESMHNLRQYDCVDEIADKINILSNNKLNNIGDSEFALSSTWYQNNYYTKVIDVLSNNVGNYFRHHYGARVKSKDLIWTTFKARQKKLNGVGYTNGFIPCNIRATNDYGDRHYLAYCINVFLNPIVVNFFESHGVKVNEDTYALSEMLQWIWRSAIRNGESINIYIPSRRMRNLLEVYLGKDLT